MKEGERKGTQSWKCGEGFLIQTQTAVQRSQSGKMGRKGISYKENNLSQGPRGRRALGQTRTEALTLWAMARMRGEFNEQLRQVRSGLSLFRVESSLGSGERQREKPGSGQKSEIAQVLPGTGGQSSKQKGGC